MVSQQTAKLFDAWLVHRPHGFKPERWTDNPLEAELRIPMLRAVPLELAREAARGFNEAELKLPLGCWVLVLEASAGHRGQGGVVRAAEIVPARN